MTQQWSLARVHPKTLLEVFYVQLIQFGMLQRDGLASFKRTDEHGAAGYFSRD